jgi:uncharacterized integral membrane protein
MMNPGESPSPDRDHGGGLRLNGRQVVGIAIAVLLVVFIAVNNEDVEVSLVFFKVSLPLWIVLAGTALLGVGIGMLLGARRTKRKYMNL